MKHFRNNPRKISKAQIERLKKTMQKYGDLSGITHILETDELITGNQRSDAGDFINQKPIIEQQFNPPLKDGTVAIGYFDMDGVRFNYRAVQGWTTAEQQEANLIANAAGGDWDWKLLETFPVELLNSAGFDEDMLKGDKVNLKGLQNFVDSQEPVETVDAEPQMERADELLKKWDVLYGDLWQIGEHLICCGDCTEDQSVNKVMGGGKARMIFTDPPWNVAIGGDLNPRHRQRALLKNDNLSSEDFSKFIKAFVSSFASACDGDMYCVLGASEWPALDSQLRAGGYHWSSTIIWVKDIFVLGRSKYHRRYEPIWYGWHKNNKSSFNNDRDLDDVWEIKRPRISEEHPTMKPVDLIVRGIENSSRKGDIVFEPFSGSGTCLIACENTGRRCRAIEISPAYVAVALERMATAFPHLEIKRL